MSIPPNPTIIGRCVEIGDDDDGNPRIVIFTTRDRLKSFPHNLLYHEVLVSAAESSERRSGPESPIREIEDDAEIYWIRVHRDTIVEALMERGFDDSDELNAELCDMRARPGSVLRIIATRSTICMEMQLMRTGFLGRCYNLRFKTPA